MQAHKNALLDATRMQMAQSNAKIDVAKAKKAIERAIALHMDHMNGKAPTTGAEGQKSQKRMMDMMVEAWTALGGA